MEITYFGGSSFYIKGKKVSVSLNATSAMPEAKVGLYSSGKPVGKSEYIIDWPGEYEVAEVSVMGTEVDVYEGKTILFNFTVDEVRFLYIPNLNFMPKEDVFAKLADTDVLIVPVGGGVVLDSKLGAKFMEDCDPKVVIPMQYDHDGAESINDFLKEIGRVGLETKDSVVLEKSALPMETTDVYVLEAK